MEGAPPPFDGPLAHAHGRGEWGARVRVSPSPWPPPLGGPTSLGRRLLPCLEEGKILPLNPLYKETPWPLGESIQNSCFLSNSQRLHVELPSPCA